MYMKKTTNKFLIFFFVCIVLYQFFLLGFVMLNHNELYFDFRIKPISYEDWTWIVNHPETFNGKLAETVIILNYIMNFTFLSGFLYVLTSKEFAYKMKKWKILASFFSAYVAYKICTLLIHYCSPDYRMYMLLLSSEILSLLLLFFILKALPSESNPPGSAESPD